MESYPINNSLSQRLEKSEQISAGLRELLINQCVLGSVVLMAGLGILGWDQGSMDKLAHQLEGLPFTTPDPKSASSLRRAESVPGGVSVKTHYAMSQGLWRLQMTVQAAKGVTPTVILLNALDHIVLTAQGDKRGLTWEGLYEKNQRPTTAVVLNEYGEKLGMVGLR